MSSNSDNEVTAGMVLEGKYRLERQLGAGGMGQVFLAEHERIERTVAIKVLHRELTDDEEVRRRFETEAKAIARLKHPNCVMLYEFGFSEEIQALFAVFEYVEGQSLERWIGRQLPVADVLEIGKQVAAGMDHAHDQSVIHRDLKPENIMAVASEDTPALKVLDFGIARIAEDDEKRTRLTKMGEMFGTPPYMSPEQVRAKLDITHATDIYAIGVILYELLEGQLPFLGDTPIATVMMHLNEEVPSIEREGVPRDLKDIVRRCLQKEPEERFETCAALENALCSIDWTRRAESVLVDPSVDSLDTESQKPSDELDETARGQQGAGVDDGRPAASGTADRDDVGMSREELASAPTIVPSSEGVDAAPVDAGEPDAAQGAAEGRKPADAQNDVGAEGRDEDKSVPTTSELGLEEHADFSETRKNRVVAAVASVAALLLIGGVTAFMIIDPGGEEPDGGDDVAAAGEQTDPDGDPQQSDPVGQQGQDDDSPETQDPEDPPEQPSDQTDEQTDEPTDDEDPVPEDDEQVATAEATATNSDDDHTAAPEQPDEEQPPAQSDSPGGEDRGEGADDAADESIEHQDDELEEDPPADQPDEPEAIRPPTDEPTEQQDDEPDEPDAIELEERRRSGDEQQQDEADGAEPQGIGLPQRD